MRVLKFLKIAWRSIIENKFRSFLTMLGVIIGIASVVILSSVSKSAEAVILGSVSSFGSDVVYIQPGSGDNNPSSVFAAFDSVKYSDYLAIKRANLLIDVAPFLVIDAILFRGRSNYKTRIVGTTPEYSRVFNFFVESGRFIEESDVNSRSLVVVLGKKVASELFGEQNPIGQDLKIKTMNFRVIGLMEEQGGNAFEDYDVMVFVPITAMQIYLNGVDYVNSIVGKVPFGKNVDDAIEDIRVFIRKRHKIDNPEGDLTKDDFGVVSQDQVIGIFGQITGVLTLFLAFIISISLIVGGIGIMNVMFVTVNQRTREIGLRKAVGATELDVLVQFLIEAILITMIGGFIGVLIGVVVSFSLALLIGTFQKNWEFSLSNEVILMAFFVAFIVGLVFGIVPARKAARLNPIEALRYE